MKKGFTLIELIGVITILGLLSLIVVPIVDKIIKDNKETLYNTQVQMIEQSAKNWASENIFSLPENTGEYIDKTICNLEASGFLELDVKNPKTDELFYKDSYVRITKTDSGYEYKYVDSGSLLDCEICVPVTEETKTTGNIPQGNYEVGDEYICEVKKDTKYHFFVLSKDDDKINLIMDRNINSAGGYASGAPSGSNSSNDNVAWISKDDYETANTDNTQCSYESCNDEGPLTALNFLHTATNDWNYLDQINEIYNDNGVHWNNGLKGNSLYNNIRLFGYARLPKFKEIYDNSCKVFAESKDSSYGSCPLWLVNYLHNNTYVSGKGLTNLNGIYGYWTLDTNSSIEVDAWFVYYQGMLGGNGKDLSFESGTNFIARYNYGIRPVIMVSKNRFKN